MPCMCWYDPSDQDKKGFKSLCVELVELIKCLSKEGDPIGMELKDAHELIDHLYHPSKCKEKK